MRTTIKRPVQCGRVIIVLDENDREIEKHDAVQLAMNWFRMTNDGFFQLYGFNWVPKGLLFDQAQRRLEEIERARYEEERQGIRATLPPNFLR